MTETEVRLANAYTPEMNAVNLADEHADEAVAALNMAKAIEGARASVAALCSLADGILALRASVDALRETLNRELPDLGAAILETRDSE